MMKKTVRWAADIGFRDKVRPAALHASPGDYGLKGPRAQGDLGFNRAVTRRVAKKDAADGLPVSEAITRDQWSEREQEVTERAEQVRRGASTWFTASATELRDYVRNATPAEIHVDTLREAIKAEETERRHHEHDDASEAEKRHEETVVELEAFKSRHGERIGERTPDIKTNIEQTIAILVAILIAEGFFNALLFKDAQAGGLIGGMVVAFAISALNVLVGVVTGFFGLRYLNHPEKPMKILGGMVAGAGILMGLFINLFIAHFRDAVEIALQAAQASGSLAGFSMFDIAPGRVVLAMFPNVFGLHSLVAFGLLAIGLTVFAIAVYEGYERITDRYPGYGRVWRKERLAYEARQQVRHGVRDDLSDYFTACRSWFESQQTRHVAAKREIEKALNALELRREKAVAICARAAEQERSQKVAYRQAHRRARNALRESLGEQAACPAYFDEIVTPDLPGLDYTRERDEARAAVTAIEQNITALNITREWLEKHIQEVQEGLSSLEARVHGEIASLREARTESRQSKRKSA